MIEHIHIRVSFGQWLDIVTMTRKPKFRIRDFAPGNVLAHRLFLASFIFVGVTHDFIWLIQ